MDGGDVEYSVGGGETKGLTCRVPLGSRGGGLWVAGRAVLGHAWVPCAAVVGVGAVGVVLWGW